MGGLGAGILAGKRDWSVVAVAGQVSPRGPADVFRIVAVSAVPAPRSLVWDSTAAMMVWAFASSQVSLAGRWFVLLLTACLLVSVVVVRTV